MKKLKFAKVKKVKQGTLKRKCDVLFSKRIRARGYCELQGMDAHPCKGSLQCMHIISRRYLKFRWDEMNAMCGCQAHHFWYENHKEDWYMLMIKHYPKLWTKLLKEREAKVKIDYQDVLDSLQKN